MSKEKPGYLTSEFYITILVAVLGFLASSGLFGPEHWAAKAVGLAMTGLSALGYTASRAKVKQAASYEAASLGKPSASKSKAKA